LNETILKIYKTRYFWFHLVRAELKNKFRRSKLGILWTFMNPLLLTLLMSIVFGAVFKMEFAEYSPYVLSGLIVWELISSSFIGGGHAIMSGEQYIRQFNHPILIYTLKSALVYTISFLIAMTALVIWIIIKSPQHILLGIASLPITILLYFLMSWAITTIAGYTNTKYRDYPQVMALVIQAVWYVSPVFFMKDMFASNKALKNLFDYNPITHILALIREPFLYGKFPSSIDYLFTIISIIILMFVAAWINKKNQKNVIFYL